LCDNAGDGVGDSGVGGRSCLGALTAGVLSSGEIEETRMGEAEVEAGVTRSESPVL